MKIAKQSVKICDFHLKLYNDNFLNETLIFKLELKKFLKPSITYVSLKRIFGDPFGTVFIFENVIFDRKWYRNNNIYLIKRQLYYFTQLPLISVLLVIEMRD